MWIAPIYARMVELADHEADIAEVRRVMAEARELIKGSEEYVFYSRELYLAGLRAEADAAQRARAAKDAQGEEEARRLGLSMAARLRELVEAAAVEGSPPLQALADLPRIEAEEARLEGRPSAEPWGESARRNQSLGNLVGVAYARLREAEALLEHADERDAATAALRAAHAIAADCGAEPLREAAEELARRSRLRLSDEPAMPAPTAEDPFGLTGREREVLVLVAAGRTNRQIGEELFMSEKTASVHVSRILAKLDVSTRGEAGAVAHKLGLDG
jgi:DNA-binding CsgD family transcriptional regulator